MTRPATRVSSSEDSEGIELERPPARVSFSRYKSPSDILSDGTLPEVISSDRMDPVAQRASTEARRRVVVGRGLRHVPVSLPKENMMRLLLKPLGRRLLRSCAAAALPASLAVGFSTNAYAGGAADVQVGHIAAAAGALHFEILSAGVVVHSAGISAPAGQGPKVTAKAMAAALAAAPPAGITIVSPNGTLRNSFKVGSTLAGALTIRICAGAGPCVAADEIPHQQGSKVNLGQTWSATYAL